MKTAGEVHGLFATWIYGIILPTVIALALGGHAVLLAFFGIPVVYTVYCLFRGKRWYR